MQTGNLPHLISARSKQCFAEPSGKTSSLDTMTATVAESAGATKVGQTRKLMAGEETTWSDESETGDSNRRSYQIKRDNILIIFVTKSHLLLNRKYKL